MNVLNRLIGILFFLIILILAIGTAGTITGLLTGHTVDQVYSYGPLHQSLNDLHHVQPHNTRIIAGAGAVLIAVLALLFLALELTPPRRERALTLSETIEGETTIGYDKLQKLAERASLDVAEVETAECSVRGDDGSVRVRCTATVNRFADATTVSAQVQAAIKQQLEHTLGRPVERVDVRTEPQRAGTRPRVR